jgi:20S proteasome alpha/beta subunit
MSLCIAATCKHDSAYGVVICCDYAGTRGDIKSEDIIKIKDVGWATVLLAGNMSHARELLAACKPFILEYPGNGDDIAITQLRQGLTQGVKIRKRSLATAELSAELGLSWDDVFTLSRQYPNDSTLLDAWHRIRGIDLGAALIVSTFTDNEPAILVIESNGRVAWADHYAAVGTGCQIAAAFLNQREYSDSMPLEECLYRVLEAKIAAEKNPYVGKQTALEFRTQDLISFVSNEYHSAARSSICDRLSSRPEVTCPGELLDADATMHYPAQIAAQLGTTGG